MTKKKEPVAESVVVPPLGIPRETLEAQLKGYRNELRLHQENVQRLYGAITVCEGLIAMIDEANKS